VINRVNCWKAKGLKSLCPMLISSQAEGSAMSTSEGSETRTVTSALDNRSHECPTSQVDGDIVRYSEETRRVSLNGSYKHLPIKRTVFLPFVVDFISAVLVVQVSLITSCITEPLRSFSGSFSWLRRVLSRPQLLTSLRVVGCLVMSVTTLLCISLTAILEWMQRWFLPVQLQFRLGRISEFRIRLLLSAQPTSLRMLAT